MAKNITLAIDEDLLDRARVLAAMKRTSVNEMVRNFLEQAVADEKARDEAREELLRLMDECDADFGNFKPSRADTYSGESRFD